MPLHVPDADVQAADSATHVQAADSVPNTTGGTFFGDAQFDGSVPVLDYY